MNVDAGSKRLLARFFRGTLHNLLYREIRLVWMFSMEKRGSNPNLIGHLNFCARCDCHVFLPYDSNKEARMMSLGHFT
jgi:hypothetical protein